MLENQSGRRLPPGTPIVPATMTRVGSIDERYQSYNVEMLEVSDTFWKPYGPELDAILTQPGPTVASAGSTETPAGMNPALYQYLPPIDLTNRRLRKLATALGPAYLRTWAPTMACTRCRSRPRSRRC